MDQGRHAGQRGGGNVPAQLKRHPVGAGLRLAGQFPHRPAARGKMLFETAANVAVAAGDGTEWFCVHAEDSQPMRWALAMAEKVMVVAGMLGQTEASAR